MRSGPHLGENHGGQGAATASCGTTGSSGGDVGFKYHVNDEIIRTSKVDRPKTVLRSFDSSSVAADDEPQNFDYESNNSEGQEVLAELSVLVLFPSGYFLTSRK